MSVPRTLRPVLRRPPLFRWPLILAGVSAGGLLACLAVCIALVSEGLATGTAAIDVARLRSDTPATLGAMLEQAAAWQRHHPWLFGVGFFLVFTVMAAVPLPGCSVLALAAGAWWGWVGGALLVTLASTVGATLAFLTARHVGRDTVQRRWGHRLHRLETVLDRHGGLFVFWLRLAPLIPYPVLNPLLGLTRLSTARFFGASAAGMFAGSALYAWIGAELGHAVSWRDLLAPPVLAALAALMLLPLAVRVAVARFAPGLHASIVPVSSPRSGR
jgi:uncharacterized membrane protein YdjX (TVP38/TMEM64 family)